MGDEVLMKKLAILPILSIVAFANVDNNLEVQNKQELVKEYQKMFEKISQQRVGLDEKEILSVKQPFITIKKKTNKDGINSAVKSKKKSFVLEAIFNNKAMINGSWYKLYQNIGDSKVVKITSSYVLIKTPSGTKKLTIRNNNASISIK